MATIPQFHADLHIHSKHSRATSRDCDLEHLALWAARKGIAVVGTGDFTHPAWRDEISDKLQPAEPGLLRLRPELERQVLSRIETSCRRAVRFTLSVEISTIYKKGGQTRKVHHLILAPHLDAAGRLVKALDKIGNLKSDGRPILGLDSRHLLEMVLESDPGSYLIPAHIWTPWFSMLGSKSGFDSIEECYGDLAPHVFALETGLSSDPPMNHRVSSLDRCRLVSNSDAHSPQKLGREACVFATDLDYFSIRRALETGEGYGGTIEFFPEEGKYHLDGHRKCEARLEPTETRARDGRCPVCGKAVTVGVMSRVEDLADRAEGEKPKSAAPFVSLIPLNEVIGESIQVGAQSKAVAKIYDALIAKLGPELEILTRADGEDIRRVGSTLLAEAIKRMRAGQVIRQAGYDGEFGVIRLFEDSELRTASRGKAMFELPEVQKEPRKERGRPDISAGRAKSDPVVRDKNVAPTGPLTALSGLDADQLAAASVTKGALLVIAGPGSGKTRTLTHRIAHLVAGLGVDPLVCLALTFSRRAAQEMAERLAVLLPGLATPIPVMTFHGLGLMVLSEHGRSMGLPRRLQIAPEASRRAWLRDAGLSDKKLGKALAEISRCKRQGLLPEPGSEIARAYDAYERQREARSLLDFDDLICLSVRLLESDAGVADLYRRRFVHVSVDEYQDVDEQQCRLVRLLCPSGANLMAIGDPDQSIYGFRGADQRFFLRFTDDYPDAKVVRLGKNYRSSSTIVDAAGQVIARSERTAGRAVQALLQDPSRIVIHKSATEAAEAEFVVQSIERMIGGHSFFSIDSGRGDGTPELDLSFSDFAVLYRTEAQAPALAAALARSGIPFQKRSHQRPAERPLVMALVEAMGKDGGAGSVLESLERAAAVVRESGADFTDEEWDDRLELLRPVASKAADLASFLMEVELMTEVDRFDPRADRVSLLTLHAAKGLEFPVVFIVGCEDGLIPLRFKKGDDSVVEEERRLFYVAMTRAQRRLVLSRAAARKGGGRGGKREASPFLAEIERRLTEVIEGPGKKPKAAPTAGQLDLF